MNTRKVLIGCSIALLAGLILAAAVFVATTLIPRKAQPKASVSPILVNINLPANGAKVPLNQPVGVYAEAVGPTTAIRGGSL